MYTAALCSSDGESIDLLFGKTTRFLVIEVDEVADAWTKVEWRDAPKRQAYRECEEWFEEVARVLGGVDYVWCAHIGPKPHRVLLANGITGMETPPDIDEAIQAIDRYRARTGRRRAGADEEPGAES